ncbi:hypothetical protein [Streptomonospora litoralis]|uniref:hypothetical protein n=1 Tax=Streptomonospora litoralis TaxID=2498135 RepID=UPI001F604380|nr:hypothetical protein [Streptomonospora litoralis]
MDPLSASPADSAAGLVADLVDDAELLARLDTPGSLELLDLLDLLDTPSETPLPVFRPEPLVAEVAEVADVPAGRLGEVPPEPDALPEADAGLFVDLSAEPPLVFWPIPVDAPTVADPAAPVAFAAADVPDDAEPGEVEEPGEVDLLPVTVVADVVLSEDSPDLPDADFSAPDFSAPDLSEPDLPVPLSEDAEAVAEAAPASLPPCVPFCAFPPFSEGPEVAADAPAAVPVDAEEPEAPEPLPSASASVGAALSRSPVSDFAEPDASACSDVAEPVFAGPDLSGFPPDFPASDLAVPERFPPELPVPGFAAEVPDRPDPAPFDVSADFSDFSAAWSASAAVVSSAARESAVSAPRSAEAA